VASCPRRFPPECDKFAAMQRNTAGSQLQPVDRPWCAASVIFGIGVTVFTPSRCPHAA
jgi:hypothetical protein